MSERLFSLENRVAVVTGGLGQLGRQFTDALTAAGARVAVLDCRDAGVPDGERRLHIRADVTDRDSMERAVEQIERRWETPHVLVNNAALDSPPDAPAGS